MADDTTPVAKNGRRSRRWCITVNNYTTDDITQIVRGFERCTLGKEVAPETGTPHLQGYIETENGKTASAMRALLPQGTHVEVAKGNRKCNRKYCCKEGDVVCDYWAIPSPLTGKDLYPWQQEILAIIDAEPDERSIYWYWEPTGNVGKTAFAKHVIISREMMGDTIYCTGKSADMKFAIMQMAKYPKVVLMGLTRSQETFVSYEGIEAIKDGIFFSGKYESGMCVGQCPHFIVFANFPPELDRLSADRWVVRKI